MSLGRWSVVGLVIGQLALISAPARAGDTVLNPERTQGLVAPAPAGGYKLVALKGPGKFVGAQITKQGGASDLSFVSLDIDGRNVVNASIAAIQNWGLTQSNPYGLVVFASPSLDTVTIGYPEPLAYERELLLSVIVNEPGVVQILANVVHGE